VLTMHRAENTAPERLASLLRALGAVAESHTMVFLMHPRTASAIRQQGLALPPQIRVCEPLGYLDTLKLVGSARALLTDSGGLQEEAAALGTPALILRNETEWRYLVDAGVHILASNDGDQVVAAARRWLQPDALAQLRAREIPLWPGTAERAVHAIATALSA
jgi:UDP-N-acetylglucosamine 2-epimerase